MTNDPGRPGWEQPPTPEEPAYGQPQYGGQPQYEHPQQYPGQPQYGGQPQYEQPQQYPGQPQYSQPEYPQQYGQTQQYEQAPYGQPYGQPQQPEYPQQYGQPEYPQQYGQPEYPEPYGAAATQQFAAPLAHLMDDPYGNQYHQPPHPPKKGRSGLIALLAGAAILLVCGGGGIAGAAYFSGDSDGDKNAAGNSRPVNDASASAAPSEPAPTATDGPATGSDDKTLSRQTDPSPVTVSELRSSTYSGSTGTFTRTGHDSETDCAGAVDKNAGPLVNGLGCTQAVSITAANEKKGCVVTFGILNMPDTRSAERVVDGMRDGTLGSFVPRRHDNPAEGKAGDPQTGTWWFVMKPYGHYVTFATGSYFDGKRVVNRDPTMLACDNDLLNIVHERLSARK